MFKKNSLINIFEQEEKPKGSPEEDVFLKNDKLKARKSKHSVDDQIDALILRYESSSIREEDEDVLPRVGAASDGWDPHRISSGTPFGRTCPSVLLDHRC